MDSGVMVPVIFVMASFCDASISYAPLWDDLVDIVPSSLVEREDACNILPRAMGDGTERIGNQLLNLCLTLKSMIRLITIYEDCLLVNG
jgi:hypothetical protein